MHKNREKNILIYNALSKVFLIQLSDAVFTLTTQQWSVKLFLCLGLLWKDYLLFIKRLQFIIAWLFTEYDVARKSQVLLWNFSIPHAMSYSVNSQATVPKTITSPFGHKMRNGQRETTTFKESLPNVDLIVLYLRFKQIFES